MYSQLGSALLPILNLESWKPALAETVRAAFDKAGYDPAKAHASGKRRVKDQEDTAPSRDDAAALFGRVDVISHVTKELLDKNESDKGAWKQSSEALDTIQAICERAGCAIAFTRPVKDMVRLLEARLSDANANLKVKAANVLATVATSVGPEIAKMSKLLRPNLILAWPTTRRPCKPRHFTRCIKSALDLISLVTHRASDLVINEATDPTVRKIKKASIVANTKISYDDTELLRLIHDYLVTKEMLHAASALVIEAKIPVERPPKVR
ncbi:hypothetical protein PsorP6_005934 [Peronosclerospora sorghi]|uniref:Uncharacterized protein n=1 Tax=Peronosclerospora sorghi TaxID=230839 RepID=A0ACC0W7X1_9STRA|nr:hypothetical protein PsorP6_005934 [Peronosclerospora sorghi]